MRYSKILYLVRGNAAAVGVALLALVVGAAAAASSAAGGGGTEADQGTPLTYSVLDRPATARDADFARSSVMLSTVASRTPQLGMNPDGLRVLRSDASQTLAVVPAKAAPCLVSEQGASGSHISCGTSSSPVTATVSYGSAVGVVPDSVNTVSFRMTDGTVVDREVVANLWEAPAEAASVSFVVNDNTVHVGLMPLSARPQEANTGPDGLTSVGKPDPNYRG